MVPERQHNSWVSEHGRDTFVALDFGIALAAGGLAAGLCWNAAVRTSVTPILLAEAAFGVAVTATVFAAMAIFATFYDPAYRRVLDMAPGGFSAALMPYGVIGVVASASAVLGTVGALAVPTLGLVPTAAVVGASTLLAVWSLAGTVSLILITMFHASQRAALMRGADEAEIIRARRIAQRGYEQPSSHGNP